jgi:hypothetical protein
MVPVNQFEDKVVRRFAMTVFEYLDEGVFGSRPPNAFGEDDGAVVRIRVTDETADKANKDVRGSLRGYFCDSGGGSKDL